MKVTLFAIDFSEGIERGGGEQKPGRRRSPQHLHFGHYSWIKFYGNPKELRFNLTLGEGIIEKKKRSR